MSAPASDPQETAQAFTEFLERSQRVAQQFWQRQAEELSGAEVSVSDPRIVSRAFLDLNTRLWANPARLAQAQMELWQQNVALWQSTMRRALGQESEPVIEPERGDRRFKDEAWSEDLVFDYIKQSYLLSATWLRGLV